MKRMTYLFLLGVTVFASAQEGVTRLRWAGPEGTRPGTYEEWIAEHPYTDFHCTLDRIVQGDGRAGTVAILTEQSLALSLANEITGLSDRLQAEGYTVASYQISGGTPDSLRLFLQNLYHADSIEGALFIGDLPVAWFEVYDFGGSLASFPMDIFYMDLDGTWLDTINTGNGKYDGHTGAISPEIYIGRLTTTGIGTDTVLLKNYFAKDMAYRAGSLDLPKRALVFVDDDWVSWAWQWGGDVALLFPDTAFFWQPETTTAALYRPLLDTAQTWVSVFAHSWPGGHQFSYNSGTAHDYYLSTEYTSQNPPASFYNFFACSFCRYTDYGYGGGRAIFTEDWGLGAIGSTKTGSMLEFSHFYAPLGDSANLGQAFMAWFDHIVDNGVTFDELCWHYGMTLLGDPFLKPTGHETGIAEFGPAAARISELALLGNPVGRTMRVSLSLATQDHVRVVLYDCLGRPAAVFLDARIDAGDYTYAWNMTDGRGHALPTGAYLLRAEFKGHSVTRKVVKL